MSALRIGAAQTASVAADIDANIEIHLAAIDAARAARVDILVFPELSLSGYELGAMAACAMQAGDARLERLRAAGDGMTVVVGAPVANRDGKPSIGAITLFADGGSAIYRKHFVHASENGHASPGTALVQQHESHGVPFALAICADTGRDEHAHAASVSGAALYLAGSLVSVGGYERDAANLATRARKYRMGVLMANHGADSGGYFSAGRSAFWAPGGELVVAAPGPGSLLVVAERRGVSWSGEVCPL